MGNISCRGAIDNALTLPNDGLGFDYRGAFATFLKQNDKWPTNAQGMSTLGIAWAISHGYPLIKSSAFNVANIKDFNTTLVLEHLSRRYLHNAYKQPEIYNKYL